MDMQSKRPILESEGNKSAKGARRFINRQPNNQNSDKTPNAIKCVFLNAETLTNKIPEFQYLIREHNPHLIGVNEILPKKKFQDHKCRGI